MSKSSAELLAEQRGNEIREARATRQARFLRGLQHEKIQLPDFDSRGFASEEEAAAAFRAHAESGLNDLLALAAVQDRKRPRDDRDDE